MMLLYVTVKKERSKNFRVSPEEDSDFQGFSEEDVDFQESPEEDLDFSLSLEEDLDFPEEALDFQQPPEEGLDFQIPQKKGLAFQIPPEDDSEFQKRDTAASTIQKAWKRYLNIAVFEHFKTIIYIRRQGEPRQIMKYINPREAELLDAAAGIQVRFRFGGVSFPPQIYYKIFTHRPIEDLCANSPRDYTKLPAKYIPHSESVDLQEEDYSGWYHRVENNGWRPVSDSFWIPTEIEGEKIKSKFHFSKLKRRQDKEKKRKIRKIEWMKQMYYTGSLVAKSTNDNTLSLIHTATKGLIKAVEDGGIDSVMEWEVDEVLNWTNTLNFDEYIANWKEIATSKSSDNFKPFRFDPPQEKMFPYEDLSDEGIGIVSDTPYETMYEDDENFTRVTPDSTYGM